MDDHDRVKAVDALGLATGEPNANREAVEEAMQSILAGNRTENDWLFVTALVRSIYDASRTSDAAPAKRADAILRATGLTGRREKHQDFLDYANAVYGLENFTKAAIIQTARDRGLIPDDLDDHAARKLLDRRLEAKPGM
jgi:hypothetical protein